MAPALRNILLFASLLAACASSRKGSAPAATGGEGGDGGRGPTQTGGTGGVAVDGGVDAFAASDGSAASTADGSPMSSAGDATTGPDDGGIVLDDPSTWPGGAYNKPFIIACPDGAPRVACCEHYCGCMAKNCGTVGSVKLPKDCMAACVAPEAVKNWDLRCRVYNCFESLNPLAQKDHVAHCEHAGARGAGDTQGKCHVAGEPSEP
jgi:hypothetical protein